MHSVLESGGPSSGIAARRAVESRDPATGEVWRRFEPLAPSDVASAVERARSAQPAWRARSVRERARVLRAFHRVLYRRRWEVADLLQRENGKPAAEAMLAEVVLVLDMARYYARIAPRVLRTRRLRPRNPALFRKRLHIVQEPFGVVGIIAPWNYPLLLAAGQVLPALVAGNAVVLKPSEYTPSSGVLLAEMLREAGVPDDAVQVLPGDGVIGAALVDAGVEKVYFTGSNVTGQRVALACAARMIPYVLELGGSDPAIVLDDAPLDAAVRGIVWGRFANAGQTCTAPKRVIVSAAVYDRVVNGLARAVATLRLGPASAASDVGPLIRPWQAAELRAQLDDAIARGARVIASTPRADTLHEGYFPPTVLVDVTPDMRVMRDETFGPLLPVVKVASDDEAIAVANRTSFGLSASVWSRDGARARRVAARLEAGAVVLNDAIMNAGIAELPHGGVKGSGTGRSHGEAGLLECVHPKTVMSDLAPSLGAPWWFAYPERMREMLDAFTRVAHGEHVLERISGIPDTLRMLLRRHE